MKFEVCVNFHTVTTLRHIRVGMIQSVYKTEVHHHDITNTS